MPSVHRAFRLLEILSDSLSGLGVSELARRTGWPKSSIHNILATLVLDGFVAQDPASGRYRMTVKLFSVGGSVVEGIDIRAVAYPFLIELAEATGETVNLGIMDGAQAIYVDAIAGPSAIRANTWPGKRLPIHRTALGKALVAELPDDQLEAIVKETGLKRNTPNTHTKLRDLKLDLQRIRKQGYAVDDEEDEIGMRCVGVPIRDYRGLAPAAISVTGLVRRLPMVRIPKLAKTMMTTANQISEQLGHRETAKVAA
ncbi:MAG: IclR family transcriptional regulator [Anaerolineales bacterium]